MMKLWNETYSKNLISLQRRKNIFLYTSAEEKKLFLKLLSKSDEWVWEIVGQWINFLIVNVNNIKKIEILL
jgi:hypothetical protein